MPEQGIHTVLKLSLEFQKKKKKFNKFFLSGRVSILHIDYRLFNLRLTVTYHHLRSNGILGSVPHHIINFNNLVVRFGVGGIVSWI